jgi:hypothetical protein
VIEITRRSMRERGFDSVAAAIEAEKARQEFENGNVAELIAKYRGDMTSNALDALVRSITGDAHQAEAIRRDIEWLADGEAHRGDR